MAKQVFTRDAHLRAHMAYSEEKHEWMALAVRALAPWGNQERTLQHAVAEALEAAYAAGQAGEYPVAPEPEAPRVFRRTRTAPEPEPTPTVIRRTRR